MNRTSSRVHDRSATVTLGLVLALVIFVATMAAVGVGQFRTTQRFQAQTQIQRTLENAIDAVRLAEQDRRPQDKTERLAIRLPIGDQSNSYIRVERMTADTEDSTKSYDVATLVRDDRDQWSIRRIAVRNENNDAKNNDAKEKNP